MFPPIAYCLFSTALLLVTFLVRRTFTRSPYVNLPGPKSKTWMGFLADIHDKDSLQFHYSIAERYGHVARLEGGFAGLQRDALYISDPSALHSILVRNQHNFPESDEFKGLFGIIHHGDSLPCVNGHEHKRQRKILNPIFTAAYISRLTPLFYRVAEQLCECIEREIGESNEVQVNMLDYLTRTALELVGQGGIGASFQQFDVPDSENKYRDFVVALRAVLPWASHLFLILPYLETLRHLRPKWLRIFLANLVSYIPWSAARNFKWCVDNMHPVFRDLYLQKKVQFQRKHFDSSIDLASLLMQANADAEEEDVLSDEVIIATYSAIIHGGQETTSGVLSRLLTVMTVKSELQSQLREEIMKSKLESGMQMDYKTLESLPLLDAVVREFLRRYPPVTFVWRKTLNDCVIPLQFPIKDSSGAERKELLIHKGTSVYIGLAATNMSPSIWGEDAEQFRPERWLEFKEKGNTTIKTPGIFGNMMTFLGGGRACPGMKFAILEMKLVLSLLLQRFEFTEAAGIEWQLGITVVPVVRSQNKESICVPIRVKHID